MALCIGFRPLREPKTLNRFWWHLAGLTMSGTAPRTITLVVVALCGWSGHIHDLSNLGVSFLTFFFLFCFLRHAGRISRPIETIYTTKRVFTAEDVPFGGLDNIWLHLGGQTPKQPPQNWREQAFSSISDRSKKSTSRKWSTDWHKISSASSDHQRVSWQSNIIFWYLLF